MQMVWRKLGLSAITMLLGLWLLNWMPVWFGNPANGIGLTILVYGVISMIWLAPFIRLMRHAHCRSPQQPVLFLVKRLCSARPTPSAKPCSNIIASGRQTPTPALDHRNGVISTIPVRGGPLCGWWRPKCTSVGLCFCVMIVCSR